MTDTPFPSADGRTARLPCPTRRAFLAGAVAVAWAGPAGAAGVTAAIGSVQDMVGDAFAERDAARRALAPAGEVFLRDLVSTGRQARLSMKLGLATTVRLGAEARLTIDRFIVEAGGVLDLAEGALLFDRPETAPKTDVKLRSAYGLIAVRGTRFFAGPSRGVFGVFVERGAVTVAAAGQTRRLGAGEGVDIPAPGAAPSPVARWGAARIREAFASVE